ncbi:hypothetical protein TWF694_005373 [Orbilia ellipsospora]|uniref:Uncharacterized protein n=1 Tax=Orbilia ellipsospora TaxID=2528407 RepID=A0AAV9WU84_9PEZI
MASKERRDDSNFEMIDFAPPSAPFSDITGAKTCPNSHDCLIGHPELRLKHIASARRCGLISKLLKALLGIVILAWAIMLDIALHSAHTLSNTNNNPNNTTASDLKLPPTKLQQRLRVPLFELGVAINSICLLILMMSILASIMRDIEKMHPGVEVYLKHSWWVDWRRVDFCLYIAAGVLMVVTGRVVRDWYPPKAV